MQTRRLLLAAAASAAAATLPATPALANGTQESIFEDDAQLLLNGPVAQEQALNEIDGLGADTLRLRVEWRTLAPNPNSIYQPAGDPTNPAYYDQYRLAMLDRAIRGAAARGIGVILNPGGHAPVWTTRNGCWGRNPRWVCQPNPRKFGQFVQMLGARYSGRWRDGIGTIPRVARWSIWNEPNHGGWLQPQFRQVGRRLVPFSPALYRDLLNAGADALRRSGHGRDQLLIGETAPSGARSNLHRGASMVPDTFLRAMLCIDSGGRSLRGADWRDYRCGRGRRLPGSAFAHHVYGIGASSSPTTRGRSGELRLADRPRINFLLSSGRRLGRIGSLPILWTEYGVQSNPPDRGVGVPLWLQAERINQAEYMTWRDPNVRATAQYELRDDLAIGAFQTGLAFHDGRAKPAYDAYRLPIYVVSSGNGAWVWGQVRPLGNYQRALVGIWTRSGNRWTRRTLVRVGGRKGYFRTYVRGRYDGYRLQWEGRRSRDAVARRG